MTKLDKDIMMAEKLGYGIHYGWYKADHPHTIYQESKPETDTFCLKCNAPIYNPRYNQKYCCTRCQSIAGASRYYQRRKESKVE